LKANYKCSLKAIDRYLKKVTPDCKDLMLKMLNQEQEQRPTAKEALRHPWFKCDEKII
jgi:serine/threonine protein kinase